MLVLIPTLFVLVFILNLVFRVRNVARNTFRREPKREQPRYDYDEFQHNCKSFMDRLTRIYKKAKIYVITPIWRGDADMETKMGIPHENIGLVIEDICKAYSNITVINGRQLTPQEPSFYWDTRLHPNDMGFLIYTNNLYKILKG